MLRTASWRTSFCFAALACVFAAKVSAGCWAGLDHGSVVERAPVIITGTITRIDESPAAERALDTAYIKVEAVHRSILTDVPAAVGKEFAVKMHSKNSRLSASTDLGYPVGTRGTWYVWVNADGQLHVNGHPQQFAKLEKDQEPAKDKIRDEIRKPETDCTLAQWTAREKERQQRDQETAKIEAARLENQRVWAKSLADPRHHDQAVAQFFSEKLEVRQQNIQAIADLAPEETYLPFIVEVLQRDPEEHVRSHAASQLGYRGKELADQARKALVAALKDPEPSPRLFAAQSLMLRKEKSAAQAVSALLSDKDQRVRDTAVRALGHLGGPQHIAPIAKLYQQDTRRSDEQWVYVDALCRLGDEDVWPDPVKRLMSSDNWNVRYFIAEALQISQSKKVVPLAIALLSGELPRAVQEKTGPFHLDPRAYQTLCTLLEARTQQHFGTDAVAWLTWWKTAAKTHNSEPINFDADSLKQLLQKLNAPTP